MLTDPWVGRIRELDVRQQEGWSLEETYGREPGQSREPTSAQGHLEKSLIGPFQWETDRFRQEVDTWGEGESPGKPLQFHTMWRRARAPIEPLYIPVGIRTHTWEQSQRALSNTTAHLELFKGSGLVLTVVPLLK